MLINLLPLGAPLLLLATAAISFIGQKLPRILNLKYTEVLTIIPFAIALLSAVMLFRLLHIVAHSLYKAHSFLASGSAVERIAASRRPGPVAIPSAKAVGKAFLAALTLYCAIGWIFNFQHKSPQAIALGAILIFGVAYLLAQGLADAAPRALTRRMAIYAVTASIGYFMLHSLALWLTAGTLPSTPAPGPLEWALQRRALDAYNQWIAAGRRLEIVRGLLALAQDRQKGLERQVSFGLRPRIILTENQQNILRRQTLVVQAEQTLASAANNLSLYWRDYDGQPVVPVASQLPSGLPSPLLLTVDPESALSSRPDLRTIDLRMQVARDRLALDRNVFLPRLDFNAEVSRDIGDVMEGGVSRRGTEARVGLTFNVPLQRSAARGRIIQTQAEIDAATRRGQALREQIVAEIETISVAVDATARLFELAKDEEARAQDMAHAERRRFEMGASDFFLVNIREEAAADAALRNLDSAYRQLVAHADLAAASADTRALGLD